MLQELHTAGSFLDSAITHYLQACSAIRRSCATGDARGIFSREQLTSDLGVEIDLLPRYVSRILEAKPIIASAQNYLRASASALPPEILACIFRYVLAIDPCRHLRQQASLPKYPNRLSHVCSNWRRAAINACDLWTHIDLTTCPRFIPRAESYVARSGQLPLHLHIHPGSMTTECEKNSPCVMFIAAYGPRVASVDLDNLEGCELIIMQTLIENSTPGLFVHFMAIAGRERNRFFLAKGQEGTVDTRGHNTLILDVPAQRLEEIMLGLTKFRSNQVLPLWDSKAYHRLIELQLKGTCEIPESRLVVILESSPQLRLLVLSCGVIDCLPITHSVKPIELVELEVLRIEKEPKLDSLIRWIAPGMKPFWLMVIERPRQTIIDSSAGEQLRTFFARSNTTRIWVGSNQHYLKLANLFNTSTTVKELVLFYWRTQMLELEEVQNPEPLLRLDTLYLTGCRAELRIEDFLRFIEAQAIREVVVCGVSMWIAAEPGFVRGVSNQVFLEQCPSVRFLSPDEPHPVNDWWYRDAYIHPPVTEY